ncbi:unnamed protein product [Fraxinus pennsylvanica]|uniref:Uncharacterized protein n=1 Tax=Fraxinus pennsylvanica TaxID=56036 RepID=A0AAD2DZA0_9LAMI|nr:unnamed protein product [Fraxinus pennsylvanica]
MASKLKLIPDIAPKEMGWKCKVVVVEKTSTRTSQKGNGTYQHLWLMDTEENKVQATIFAQNIKALENTLVPLKTYLISNAYVKNTEERFRSAFGHTQWTITGSTRIEESDDDHSPLVESCFQFTPFDELQNYLDTDVEIAFAGIAVDVRPKRKIPSNNKVAATVQDIVLVTSFKVISLSTKANSSILINPKFEKLSGLREWVQRNKDILTEIIFQKSYDLPNISWMSYAQLNEMYFCNYYKYMHARALPRARCNVHITDATGSISASLFGEVAEKFLQLPAETLMKDCLTSEDFIKARDLNCPVQDRLIYMNYFEAAMEGLVMLSEIVSGKCWVW